MLWVTAIKKKRNILTNQWPVQSCKIKTRTMWYVTATLTNQQTAATLFQNSVKPMTMLPFLYILHTRFPFFYHTLIHLLPSSYLSNTRAHVTLPSTVTLTSPHLPSQTLTLLWSSSQLSYTHSPLTLHLLSETELYCDTSPSYHTLTYRWAATAYWFRPASPLISTDLRHWQLDPEKKGILNIQLSCTVIQPERSIVFEEEYSRES